MKTMAFVHGWANGPSTNAKILKVIQNSDFKLTSSPEQADIILTHSLGAFVVPKYHQAKLVVMINPPYWPGRSAMSSVTKNIRLEDTYSHGLAQSAWILAHQVLYILRDLAGDARAFLRARKLMWPVADRYILVRNSDDTFCSSQIKQVMPKNCRYVELPGTHGDLYRQPEKYLEVIKKYAD